MSDNHITEQLAAPAPCCEHAPHPIYQTCPVKDCPCPKYKARKTSIETGRETP